jgi:hypothetical protein
MTALGAVLAVLAVLAPLLGGHFALPAIGVILLVLALLLLGWLTTWPGRDSHWAGGWPRLAVLALVVFDRPASHQRMTTGGG